MKHIVKYEVMLSCVLSQWTQFISLLPKLCDQKGRDRECSKTYNFPIPELNLGHRRGKVCECSPSSPCHSRLRKEAPRKFGKRRQWDITQLLIYSLLTCWIVIFLFPFAAFHSQTWLNTSYESKAFPEKKENACRSGPLFITSLCWGIFPEGQKAVWSGSICRHWTMAWSGPV